MIDTQLAGHTPPVPLPMVWGHVVTLLVVVAIIVTAATAAVSGRPRAIATTRAAHLLPIGTAKAIFVCHAPPLIPRALPVFTLIDPAARSGVVQRAGGGVAIACARASVGRGAGGARGGE